MIKAIRNCLLTPILLILISGGAAYAQIPESRAHYLANEGLMVVHGDTKVLFDPLFRNSYGQYQLLPKAMEEALFSGTPPFDGIDAVFISHYHGDHFSPADILRLLRVQPALRLYAPAQAVEGLNSVASDQDQAIFERVVAVNIDYKEEPLSLEMKGLLIEAVRIPHSGWPNSRTEVENINWRVTLDGETTVLHMGDADPADVHFAHDSEFWESKDIHIAFPPYWFFMSHEGRHILEHRLDASDSVGVHVPVKIPADPMRRPSELKGVDLFTRPGETRVIKGRSFTGAE